MDFNRLLRAAILVGLFIVPFIPLVVTTSLFFPYITGKNFLLRFVVEIIFALWLILALRDPQYRPKFSWIAVLFGAFLLVMGFADALSANAFKSFWSNYERMEGYITLLHLGALFLVVGSVLNGKKLWNALWNTSLGVATVVALYGALQLFGVLAIQQSGTRLDATLGNASYLAIYMLFHVFIALLLFFRTDNKTLKGVYGILAAFFTVILYHTATRGAILGLLGGAGFALLLFALFERQRPRLRKSAYVGLAVIAILVGGFMLVKNTSFVKESPVLSRLASITLQSGQTRFRIWTMGWEGFSESPKTVLIGWGQESFNYVFNKYYNPHLYSQEQWFDRVHDIVFDWLIAGGALGLLAYFALFFSPLYYVWRRGSSFDSIQRVLFTGAWVGYLIHNIFVFDNITSYILFVLFLAYVHSREGVPGKIARVEPLTGSPSNVLSPLILIVAVFVVYFANVPSLLAGNDLLHALAPGQGNAALSLTYYKKALDRGGFGTQEIREQLIQAAANGAQSGKQDVVAQFATLAATEMQKQITLTPQDARFPLFMGTLFDAFGQFDQSFPYLEQASKLSPNKQQILFEMGLNRLNAGKISESVDILKRAFELDTMFDSARMYYVTALYYAGQTAEADGLISERFGSLIVDNDLLLKVYYDRGMYDRAAKILRLRIEKEPKNVQLYLSLAALYLKTGDRAQSIVALEQAIAADPSFKDQGESYVRDIRAGKNPQ